MVRKYRNPPVIEAVCEFRFSQETKWDLTIPGLLYSSIKDQFPTREQKPVQEIRLTNEGQGIKQEVASSSIMVLMAEDRQSFVQVADHQLSIHHVAPYPTWTMVIPKIERVFQCVSEITEITGFDRLGLRYVNRIEFQPETRDISHYFNYHLHFGEGLPTALIEFIAGSLVEIGNGQDVCRIMLTNSPVDNQDKLAFLLDLDYSVPRPGLVTPDRAISWVNEAHNGIENIFENCITDHLREVFGELKE